MFISKALRARQLGQWLALAVVAASAAPAQAANTDVDSARNKGVAWLLGHQRGDGAWTSQDGTSLPMQATSAAVIALKAAGLGKSPSYAAAVSYVGNADVDSMDSMARKAAALSVAGFKSTAQAEVDRLYAQRGLDYATVWSSYGGTGDVDILDTALGLRALRMADANYGAKLTNVVFSTICKLTPYLIVVGEASLAPMALPSTVPMFASISSVVPRKPSVLATAAMLAEMDALRRAGIGSFQCGRTPYTMPDLVAQLTAWLGTQQDATGGFGEQRAGSFEDIRSAGSPGSPSVFVTALVYRTLSGLATPPQPATDNALKWLIAQQFPDGSWGRPTSEGASGSNDGLVTAQVLWALPAPAAAVADADRDGIPDAIEPAAKTNPNLADSRTLLTAPSLATPSSAPLVLGNFRINTYSALGPTVTAQSWKPGVTLHPPFRLTAGSLPPGMALDNNSGQIVGTPTVAGSYVFQLTDSVGNVSWDRIDVAGPAIVAHAVPLPPWSVGLLAALLGLALWRQRRPTQRAA